MPVYLERVALWLAGLSLTLVLWLVLWPVVVLSKLADALVHIDVRSEDI
jgi:hypothetical protein